MLGECACVDGYEPINKGAACTACDAVSMVDGHGSSDLLNHKLFMAILFAHYCVGDTLSRKVAYYFPPCAPPPPHLYGLCWTCLLSS